MGILEKWKLTSEELDEIMQQSPSLRGFTFGYVSEYKLKKIWFSDNRVNNVIKPDDHDRTKKGDIAFLYRGYTMRVEVKSLQTNSIKQEHNSFTGIFQCDASDRRQVRLPNGEFVQTTCLVIGEFDIVAVCLFQYTDDWIFAFAKNADLPRASKRYKEDIRKYLLASSIRITWPLQPPFSLDPFPILDAIIHDREGGAYHPTIVINPTPQNNC